MPKYIRTARNCSKKKKKEEINIFKLYFVIYQFSIISYIFCILYIFCISTIYYLLSFVVFCSYLQKKCMHIYIYILCVRTSSRTPLQTQLRTPFTNTFTNTSCCEHFYEDLEAGAARQRGAAVVVTSTCLNMFVDVVVKIFAKVNVKMQGIYTHIFDI